GSGSLPDCRPRRTGLQLRLLPLIHSLLCPPVLALAAFLALLPFRASVSLKREAPDIGERHREFAPAPLLPDLDHAAALFQTDHEHAAIARVAVRCFARHRTV